MFMELKQVLHGHAYTLLERSTTKAILSDTYNNDMPKVNALLSAYDVGILKIIRENFPIKALQRSNAINRLISQHSMLEATAAWAIDVWIGAIDSTILSEIENVEAEKEAERQAKLFPTTDPEVTLPTVREEPTAVPIISKEDRVDLYTNVKLDKIPGKIFIPCGVGNTDYGFYICGIEERDCSTAPTVYALIYNYLTRNSCITPEDYPHYLNSPKTTYQLNYQRVYRLMMIILQLIKNGQVKKILNIAYTGKVEELQIATDIINHYAQLFSRIIKIKPISLVLDHKKKPTVTISLDKRINGIYIEENNTPCNAREIWFGEKINYRLDTDNLSDLEYILSEISPFDSFKEGQFTALKNMLGSNGHSICIMPTGSGKSLIFYMASLLQPLPMFILAPTEILIDDQIRNLRKFHHMDNVSHLKLTADNDFSQFEIRNSLLYLTPGTFQSRHLLVKARHINNGNTLVKKANSAIHQEVKIAPGPSISYVVLDEIHCLSNWGHDFRPEYLMLSQYLNKFLDRITFLGFTATANYTVVEDIQQQLKIPQRNIFSPVEFEKYNISYHFHAVKSFDSMLQLTCEIVSEHIRRDERTIVFTKNEEISGILAQAIGYEADVFQKENTSAYHLFADEKCRVLVASEDMGIGINLPNIQNIVHFGLPVSKNEFVQEIGRAGRSNESVNSYVIYLEAVPQNVPPELLKRELEIPNISDLLKTLDNDYSDCYRKLNNNIDSKTDLLQQIMQVYQQLESEGKGLYTRKYPLVSVDAVKKYIYMLYTLGYVNDWYSYSGSEKEGFVEILIDVSSTNHDYYMNPLNMLNRVKQRAVSYYDFLGSNREQIVRTQRAKSVAEIIQIYVDWYYAKFLYHHKEMFLDFLEFVEANRECDSDKVTEDIREYFTLPFIEIKSDEIYYTNLTMREIAEKVSQGIGKNTLANIERINSNRYSINLDFMILLGTLRVYGRLDENRFERILKNATSEAHDELRAGFEKVFEKLSPDSRLRFIDKIAKYERFFGSSTEEVCTALYKSINKDIVFYGLIASAINKKFALGRE